MARYYFDTCIWIDHFENRVGLTSQPIGNMATKLFLKVIKEKHELLYSDLTVNELGRQYTWRDIEEIMGVLKALKVLFRIEITTHCLKLANEISIARQIPQGDVMHALIAKQHHAILVTRDRHMKKLMDIVSVRKPEELY